MIVGKQSDVRAIRSLLRETMWVCLFLGRKVYDKRKEEMADLVALLVVEVINRRGLMTIARRKNLHKVIIIAWETSNGGSLIKMKWRGGQ